MPLMIKKFKATVDIGYVIGNKTAGSMVLIAENDNQIPFEKLPEEIAAALKAHVAGLAVEVVSEKQINAMAAATEKICVLAEENDSLAVKIKSLEAQLAASREEESKSKKHKHSKE